MLCVVIQGPSFALACKQVEDCLAYADLFEFRLDLFDRSCLNSIQNLRGFCSCPVLFTRRNRRDISLDILCKAALHGDFVDLEFPEDVDLVEKVLLNLPGIKIVLSFHDFDGFPESLDTIYCEMKKIPAFFYKIAVLPKNSVETMRLLVWANKKNTDKKLVAIPMGEYGQFGRILAPVLGFPLMFASSDDFSTPAPGMLSAQALIERYRFHERTSSTGIYALIGSPVSRSLSDISHNAFFYQNKIDAIYVKIDLKPDELGLFLEYAKQIPFRGLSVTMPLKEVFGPFLDAIDPLAMSVGSINTIKFEKGKMFGYNTDVYGARRALETKRNLKDLRAVVLGAGGAARAIVYALILSGAYVTILNRNPERAEVLGDLFGCQVCDWENFPENYDVLVNCTPLSMPIRAEKILPKSLVFDVVATPKETAFIQEAKKRGCQTIYGIEMFTYQAIGQFNIWF